MPYIETKIDHEKDLTIQAVIGPVSLQDACDALDRYYAGLFTKLILWDLTRAEISSYKTEHIIALVRKVKQYHHLRKGGKTAMVISKDLDYGLTRIYQAYAETEGIAFEIRIFRDMEKAKEWLGVE
jgi:hypothetical protein